MNKTASIDRFHKIEIDGDSFFENSNNQRNFDEHCQSILFRVCPKTQKILRDNSLEIFNKM